VIGSEYLKPLSVNASGFLQAIGGGAGGRGLMGEYFDNPDLAGEPVSRRVDPKVDSHWTFLPPAPGLRTGWYSVRWQRSLVGPGWSRRIGVEGNDGFRSPDSRSS
jgi:beta-glucosidase